MDVSTLATLGTCANASGNITVAEFGGRPPRQPVRLVYYEGCLRREDALRREGSLKSGKGKRYLRSRLVAFLSSLGSNKVERH